MSIDAALAAELISLCGAKKTSDGYRSKCPSHRGDNDTALHIWDVGGKFAVKCHAHDCSLNDIFAAVGLDPKRRPKTPQEQVFYDYEDENGNLLYQAVRYYKDGKKRFYQRRPTL
jgi:hypothetical protein